MRNFQFSIYNFQSIFNFKIFITVILILLVLASPNVASALYQPWKAEQEARQIYQQKLATFSPDSQKKLTNLANQIVEINKRKTNELTMQTEAQGMILQEFTSRNPDDPGLERASYWLTYAHEAVAFQAAKNYIFDLSTEANIKPDAKRTVGQFKSDLNTVRKKVLDSQVTIEKLVGDN